ncbi:hypothetical protein M5K25_025613 [Dendrobium thyrsiflorum]|uniref:ditrans,polycis-polyprenyl diphosphate synthase [(2E,6E)-farnesyldiphosphate specific] n=1 Tax=Dendrobium thyrsiflorum TaxID=117978 RepID=A0ABD0U9R0_DENTH
MKKILAPSPLLRFQMSWFMRLALRLCWWTIHLVFSIYQFGAHLLQVFESYSISVGLSESYRNVPLHNLRHLAVVVDSDEARNTLKVKQLLLWLSNIGVKSLMLYDVEGILKKSLDGGSSSFINGMTSVPRQNKMTVELLSFADNKGGLAKAASFLCSKYLKEELASCDRQDFRITETEISDALNIVGCGGPDPDLLLIYGPVRCHLGFPAWRICYTEIVHMGPLKSMKYGAILKAFFEFSKKQQNYGT